MNILFSNRQIKMDVNIEEIKESCDDIVKYCNRFRNTIYKGKYDGKILKIHLYKYIKKYERLLKLIHDYDLNQYYVEINPFYIKYQTNILLKRHTYILNNIYDKYNPQINKDDKIMVLDTETTGLLYGDKHCYSEDIPKYPYVIQLSYGIYNSKGKEITFINDTIYPGNFKIEPDQCHGITQEMALRDGINIKHSLDKFLKYVDMVDFIVCHNTRFDINVLLGELYKNNFDYNVLSNKPTICTMLNTTRLPDIDLFINLNTLHNYLFMKDIKNWHDAKWDVINLKNIFFKLVDLGFRFETVDYKIRSRVDIEDMSYLKKKHIKASLRREQ